MPKVLLEWPLHKTEPSIRDVITFPKTAKGTCLMTDSPSSVTARQLRDLYIDVKVPKKE